MGKYKSVEVKSTLADALDKSDIEELRDEMQSWIDNMAGTALENTNKYSMAEEAVSELDRVDELDLDAVTDAIPEKADILKTELIYHDQVPKAKRQSTSRAVRLSNAVGRLDTALSWLESWLEEQEAPPVDQANNEDALELDDLRSAVDEAKSNLDDLNGVEFPGMFS